MTLGFNAVVALREVISNNERAPAFDVTGLSADRRTWVKIGALWEYSASGSGEVFFSGRVDDPSLEKALDVALFRQEDGSYNVSWRRPRRPGREHRSCAQDARARQSAEGARERLTMSPRPAPSSRAGPPPGLAPPS